MVDQLETDILVRQSLVDAEAHGDDDMVDALRELGEPPYEDTLDYPVAIASNPPWLDFDTAGTTTPVRSIRRACTWASTP
jgi:proline iminopeptidase